MVGAFTREFWQRLCRALDRERWITDPRFTTNPARLEHRDVLLGELADIFASRTREQWLAILDAADVPNSPVLELHDAVRTEQVAHNRSLRPLGPPGQEFEVVRSAIRVEAWGEDPAGAPPGLGADTSDVLETVLGMDRRAIGLLAAAGIIQCGPADAAARPRQ